MRWKLILPDQGCHTHIFLKIKNIIIYALNGVWWSVFRNSGSGKMKRNELAGGISVNKRKMGCDVIDSGLKV